LGISSAFRLFFQGERARYSPPDWCAHAGPTSRTRYRFVVNAPASALFESSMEEQNSSSSPGENAAALSASALRALEDRAQAALNLGREKAARLEADLTRQLDAIDAAINEQLALDSQSSTESAALHAEIARLNTELKDSRAAWQAERVTLEAQVSGFKTEAAKFDAEREAWQSEREKFAAERKGMEAKLGEGAAERAALEATIARLESAKTGLDSAKSSWEVERTEWEIERSASESQRKDLEAKLAALLKERSEWETERSESESKRKELESKLAQLQKERAELDGKLTGLNSEHTALEFARAQWETERAAFEARCEQADGKLAQLEAERSEWEAKRSRLESERTALEAKLASVEGQYDGLEAKRAGAALDRAEFESERAAWQQERADLEAERSKLAAQLQTSQEEWRNQLLDFEGRLREQQSSWTEQRTDWSLARSGLERARDELQQKFDLALADVQRLRARVAEMEQDLARRPETNQADSPELVALRAERDALSARVEELEQRPATHIDPNAEQQMSDLRRRFELAVEDVRELKTKNAQLETQLAARKTTGGGAEPDTGGSDWESQKRRLLAALENGDENGNPLPQKDRATIQGTIAMTDAVVAEKDREIKQLQTQLAAGVEGAACQLERDPKVTEMIDSDEVIAQHRQRVRELEQEMEQKLRTAELELSVERAKMARQKMELDEMKSDLESQRQAFEAAGGPPVQGQPRRKWLSKLGLKDEE
jgi:chromosome segregation ATPase